MKFRPWDTARWISLLAGASFLMAHGAEAGEKPAAPDANLAASLTNLNRSTPGADRLRQLEDQMTKSLQPFSPGGSLDSILTPRYVPPPMPAPNRRDNSRERDNWIFGDPNARGGAGRDPFKSLTSPGRPTSLEELYKSLEPRQPGGAGSSKPNGPTTQGLKPF